MISGGSLNYYRDKIDYLDDNASDGKSFIYKTKIVGNAPERPGNERDANQPPILNVEVTILLKYFSNCLRFLDLSLINCEIELDLSWTRDCVLIEQNNNITGVNFVTTSTNLFVPIVTLSINDNIKVLENIRQAFKRTISQNKYRSEVTTLPKNNNLDYLIDPTFINVNRLFVILLKNGNDEPTRDSFVKYCMLLVEIKDFNVLIDNQPFLISQ